MPDDNAVAVGGPSPRLFAESTTSRRPVTGATVLGREVDAFWPAQKLMVEADSWEFHRHRAAFERDRERDAVPCRSRAIASYA